MTLLCVSVLHLTRSHSMYVTCFRVYDHVYDAFGLNGLPPFRQREHQESHTSQPLQQHLILSWRGCRISFDRRCECAATLHVPAAPMPSCSQH